MGPGLCIIAREMVGTLVTPLRMDETLASVAPAMALLARAKNVVKRKADKNRFRESEAAHMRSRTPLNPEKDLHEARNAKAPMERRESPSPKTMSKMIL